MTDAEKVGRFLEGISRNDSEGRYSPDDTKILIEGWRRVLVPSCGNAITFLADLVEERDEGDTGHPDAKA